MFRYGYAWVDELRREPKDGRLVFCPGFSAAIALSYFSDGLFPFLPFPTVDTEIATRAASQAVPSREKKFKGGKLAYSPIVPCEALGISSIRYRVSSANIRDTPSWGRLAA